MVQDMQQSKVGLAEEYSKEKKKMKSLQAQLATWQREKVDLVDSHKASHFSSLPIDESIKCRSAENWHCLQIKLSLSDCAVLCCAALCCKLCWYMLFKQFVAFALFSCHCCIAGSRQVPCSAFACFPVIAALQIQGKGFSAGPNTLLVPAPTGGGECTERRDPCAYSQAGTPQGGHGLSQEVQARQEEGP